MITFNTLNNFERGAIQAIIKASYSRFFEFFPDERIRLYKQWETEDQKAFDNPETIGRCTRITCMNEIRAGYFSWDDRSCPTGIIGQNCVLPEFRYQGIGKKQIDFIINTFRDLNYKRIEVITGDHEFFMPGQKIYRSYGFEEYER